MTCDMIANFAALELRHVTSESIYDWLIFRQNSECRDLRDTAGSIVFGDDNQLMIPLTIELCYLTSNSTVLRTVSPFG